MAKTTASQPETDAELPAPTSLEVEVNDRKYEILRFPYGKGPNLAQTIAIAKSKRGKEMLTLMEAKEIRDDDDAEVAFRNVLKLGEWGHVRYPESDELSKSASLANMIEFGRLYIDEDCPPERASSVVFLKKTGGKAAARTTA